MPATFKSPADVMNDMVSDWQSITGVQLDPQDMSREEVIKMWPMAGAISSFYSELVQTDDDHYPGSASEPALEEHLAARGLPARILAQPSQGVVQVFAPTGTPIPINTTFLRTLTGDSFVSLLAATTDGTGQVLVQLQSSQTGQAMNIGADGEAFTLASPISGVTSPIFSTTSFADGRDLETPAEMLARVQAHDQNEDTGGNLAAYERLAVEASSSVVTATAIKNNRGPGTCDVVITSGTTDIAGAIAAGLPVVRIPSSGLIATVQTYIQANNPTTDDSQVLTPTESPFQVTLTYRLLDITQDTLFQAAVTQIIQIYLYSAASGDTIDPTVLERQIDASLGHLLASRRVANFGGGTPPYTIPAGTLLTPGTLTLTAF